MLIGLLLLACTAKTDDSAAAAAPSVTWLTPSEGDTLAAGAVGCAVVVDAFTLEDPAKHSEGGAEGYIRVAVDGTEALLSGTTTFDLDLTAGSHTLEAALYYVDGDEVSATEEALCEEGDTNADCAPVAATISVTVE